MVRVMPKASAVHGLEPALTIALCTTTSASDPAPKINRPRRVATRLSERDDVGHQDQQAEQEARTARAELVVKHAPKKRWRRGNGVAV